MRFQTFSIAAISAINIVNGLGFHIDVSHSGDVGIDVKLNENPRNSRHEASATTQRYTRSKQPSTLDGKEDQYILEFSHGFHQGFLSDDGSYITWSNIPYATPPNSEDTRWARPFPPDYTDGVIFNGTGTKKCPQAQDDTGSEDCLYLDIYVPKPVWDERSSRKFIYPSTGIWIHGGGFTSGSKHDLISPSGLFKASVDTYNELFIFVAINYRLGMFGWMGGKEYVSEFGTINLGIEDQKAAIEWVYNEISRFGGTNGRIQLIGQEAGATSIMHHLTYLGGETGSYRPRFQGAILMSPEFTPQSGGTVLDKKYAAVLSAAGVKNLDDLAACSSSTLQKINQAQISKPFKGQFSFGPTNGSTEQPSLPSQMIQDGKFFKNIAVLSGYTTQDDFSSQCYVYYLTSAMAKYRMPLSNTYRYVFGADPTFTGADLNYLFYPQKVTSGATADSKLATKYQNFVANQLRFWDPNSDPENEDWPAYTKDSPKVMVLGHKTSSGQDYNWKLENDPMSSSDQAKCDSLRAGTYEVEPKYELPVLSDQRPGHHMEMI